MHQILLLWLLYKSPAQQKTFCEDQMQVQVLQLELHFCFLRSAWILQGKHRRDKTPNKKFLYQYVNGRLVPDWNYEPTTFTSSCDCPLKAALSPLLVLPDRATNFIRSQPDVRFSNFLHIWFDSLHLNYEGCLPFSAGTVEYCKADGKYTWSDFFGIQIAYTQWAAQRARRALYRSHKKCSLDFRGSKSFFHPVRDHAAGWVCWDHYLVQARSHGHQSLNSTHIHLFLEFLWRV